MYSVSIMRITVMEEKAVEFEKRCEEQVASVRETEPGNCLSLFARRDAAGSTVLPAPRTGRREYIHLQAYATQEAGDVHRGEAHDTPARELRKHQDGSVESERYDTPGIVTGITRDCIWDAGLYRFGFHRFQVKEGMGEELEEHMSHQIGIVTKGEPGTPLYTFCRRPAEGSSLLPAALKGRSEYLHLAAFETEEAYDRHAALARRKDGKWAWASTFPPYLDAPLVNESFYAGSIVCGFSRYAQWGTVWGDVDIAPFG